MTKAMGMTTAPIAELRSAMPGRPTALVAGANSTCSTIHGIAKPSRRSSGTVPSHFSPSKTWTSGSAVTASPRQNGMASSMMPRTETRKPRASAAGSACIRDSAVKATSFSGGTILLTKICARNSAVV